MKNKIYEDVHIPLLITIILFVITVILSIFFNEIPFLIKIGIYNNNVVAN